MEINEHTIQDNPRPNRRTFQEQHGIIGNSEEMREIIDTVMQVAPTDITVMLTGESGTGKEVLAQAIHQASKRSSKKFIPVNCGAIPEGIIESELFGHEKGSFTGAGEVRKGYFEIADGGTVFLDEIGDMPLSTQVKILRVLESGEFMRVGSSEPRTVNVRVVTASNKDLETEVANKRFRQDLYYRLRSVNIRIPPLRSRRSDISLFVSYFLGLAKKSNPENTVFLTDDAVTALMRYSWPGNIRELKHLIESVVVLEYGHVVDELVIAKYLHSPAPASDDRPLPMILGKSSDQAERELIFRALLEIRTELVDLRQIIERAMRVPLSLPAGEKDSDGLVSLDDYTLEAVERMMIERAYKRFEGNRRMVAQVLGVSERTLYRKINDYHIQ